MGSVLRKGFLRGQVVIYRDIGWESRDSILARYDTAGVTGDRTTT